MKRLLVLVCLAAAGVLLFAGGYVFRGYAASDQCLDRGGSWNAPESLCALPSQPENKPDYPHWENKQDKYRNSVFYYFGDGEGTRLVGVCDSEPMFMLDGGNYPFGSDKFELTIDGQRWTLNAFQGEHGRMLPMYGDPKLAERIARAKDRIIIQVGSWRRELKPGPELDWFVSECRQMRKRDPKAVGKNSPLR